MTQNPAPTGTRFAFSAVTLLFFMWGFISCMNDLLIPKFKAEFDLTQFQANLVQFFFFGAYFLVSFIYFIISATKGDPINKIGYKNGLVLGLILTGGACLVFYPAANAESYPLFLTALCLLGSGVTIIQIAANPYISILGPESSASSRLNLSQGLNSLGYVLTPLIGGYFLFKDDVAAGLDSVKAPYLGLAVILFVIAVKWILLGRYRPRAAPMWTPFVWLSEAVTNLYESLAVPNFLNGLRGTPMLPAALRLLGARIGRGVFLNTTDLTEFDCVRIGDEAELNAFCGPQTHLFEDRVMKIGHVVIGARVTVGARSTILYDAHVGDDVCLGPLTLVAKGEHLPPATNWTGSPASPTPAPP